MYELFSQISSILSQPFLNMVRSTEGIPLLFAFLLGIVGASAPCQFTGNLGAITVYGNKSIQKRIAWSELLFFILGKVLIFSLLGMIVWMLGSEVKSALTLYFPGFKKIVGPLLILIGLFMLGIIKLHKSLTLGSLPERLTRQGNLGAFL